MHIIEHPRSQQTSQFGETLRPELQPPKIIDFFAARRTLFQQARVKDETVERNQTTLRAASRSTRRVHLPDPLTDALLLLGLATAVLFAISGLGQS
jgi:hypothetical protein